MAKISLTIDVSKINKDKIVERKFKNKEGEEVIVKDYKIDVVELKAPKFIKAGDTWEMFKTHFVVESKENREEKDNFIGEGISFRLKSEEVSDEEAERKFHEVTENDNYPTDDSIDPEDIPF